MKKKGILIFVVLLISVAAIFFANEMQKKLVSNEVASKTESKALQGGLKENTKDDNVNTQNTEKASDSEMKNEETKDASKTAEQNSSNKVNETSKQNTSKTSTPKSSSTNTAASTSTSTSTNASQTSNGVTNPNQGSLKPNFFVRDARNNNVLVSKHIDFNGETVADITKQNVECKVKSGDYFYEIAGLKERSDGPLSGWCYFINGSKPGIGSGSYALKKDDIIEWKFLKDGVNN